MRVKRNKMILLVFFFIFLVNGKAYGDWFSDYTSFISSDPNYFETQRRGILSLGGASYRVKTQRTPFINITMPRIQAGCGGIDAFWGGLGYMQPEYLVQAFQNIMSAAPAFAFKVALKVLCEQCDDIMTSLESIANLINQMAMDECAASRALVNAGGNYITNKLQEMGYSGLSSSNTYLDSKLNALKEDLQTAKNWLDDFYGTQFCGFTQDEHSVFGACKEFASFANGPKSFWQNLARQEDVKNTSLDDFFDGCNANNGVCDATKILIGLFGDIYIGAMERDSEGIVKNIPIKYEPPADPGLSPRKMLDILLHNEDANTLSIKYFANGGYKIEQVSLDFFNKINFGKKAKEALNKIANSIDSGKYEDLDQETKEFINQQAFPLWRMINVFAYQGSQAVQNISSSAFKDYAAISGAYYFLNQISQIALIHLQKYFNTLERGSDFAPVSKNSLIDAKESLLRNITLFKRELTEEYQNALSKIRDNLSRITTMTMLEREITSRMIEKFGYSPFKFYK